LFQFNEREEMGDRIADAT